MRILAALLLTSVSLAAQPARRSAQPQAAARPQVTTPVQEFGHEIGADYVLPNYTQLHRYWEKLARQSNRMNLDTIGTTAEGRPQIMAIVSSPENLARVDRYRTIARRLALAQGVDSIEALALAREGKAIIWIDGGLHSTEVLGAQQLTQTLYDIVSGTDAETMRILRDVVILFVHANPDGMELVSNWYMREPEPTKRSTSGIPRLYQKYIGHDNNRDFYMSTQPESEAMNRAMYREWFPQIMYNHHQTGPAGTVLFAPPFRDPFNYNYDPLIPLWIDLVGANMHARFVLEGKPGSTMRSGANYSTWWNGGLRTTAYFHNIIGLLTETIGNPTPIQIPFIPALQLPRGDMPAPIAPQQTWKFRRSVEYSVTANRSLLDLASRHREQLLFNIWRMGMNSIERGSRDHWTTVPDDIDRVTAAIARDSAARARPDSGRLSEGFQPARTVPTRYFDAILRDPARRDPRGYIIPSSQPDFPTATKFVEALLENGISVHRATAAFDVQGKRYPAGSYVVLAAQAFRPHVRDMFEPQNHPNDFPYPGGPPRPPYDNAGYTLAFQMGVQFDRILDGFTGPFQPISLPITPPPGRVVGAAAPPGWLFSLRPNNASSAAIRLLTAGEEVWRVDGEARAGAESLGSGAYWVRAGTSTAGRVRKYADSLGIDFHASAQPAGARRIGTPRIALWDRYGGSMPSGWVRWILEQNGFPYTVVYPRELDAGNLNAKYDVIVFVDEAIPERDDPRAGQGPFSLPPERIPTEFHDRLGSVTVATTVPQLRAFLMNGGTVLTIGRSTSLATHLGLPIANALMNRRASPPRALNRQEFYIPGSVLRVTVDSTRPIAQGLPSELDVFFDESPAFTLQPAAGAAPGMRVERVAWFASPKPLRSGWAWGQEHLDGAVAIAEATVGKGKLYLFGPEITFRAQPHGTFKFLFNGLLLSAPR